MRSSYREIWCVDFEFYAPDGERPLPICVVAIELNSCKLVRLFGEQLHRTIPPYNIEPDALFVAYYASAELGCHLALGWPMPANVIDLYAEFRNYTNGVPTPMGKGLLGALSYFGLDGIGAEEKGGMRELAIRGGPYTDEEAKALLDYCQGDVEALARLWSRLGAISVNPFALLRGRYMTAAARMEWAGVPIDIEQLGRLRHNWGEIQALLIKTIDREYGVFEASTFKHDRFEDWLVRQEIPWPRLPTNRLTLDDETFKSMSRAYPQLAPLRELRVSLAQLRLSSLSVGGDRRNRCMLSAFSAKTGRNQPSNSKFIFGPSAWVRSLIRPEAGYGLAYIDWSQQEFGIAAALSGDQAMLDAYESGDPYLAFGKQVGAIPLDGTKNTYPAQREQFKACVLAVQYGMGPESLAQKIGQPEARAKQLLQLHQEAYPTFWQWSDSAVNRSFLTCSLDTVFGWGIRVDGKSNPRSLANFPMQGNGAEMLRLACIAATEQGVAVCAPVHDALLIEAPLEKLEAAIWTTQRSMRDASAAVLGGFELRSDVNIVSYPNRYVDERGAAMWETVMDVLDEIEKGDVAESLLD